jgi:hypothetical protein
METLVPVLTGGEAQGPVRPGETLPPVAGPFGVGGEFSWEQTGKTLLDNADVVGGALNQFAQYYAGKSVAEGLSIESSQLDLQARAEKLKAQQKALQIAKERNSTVAAANALFAKRGIALSSGTADKARQVSQSNAQEAMQQAMLEGDIDSTAYSANAAERRISARAARSRSLITGLGMFGENSVRRI